MSPIQELTDRHCQTYQRACKTMREIREEIHQLRMKFPNLSTEQVVLDEAYRRADQLINDFHTEGMS